MKIDFREGVTCLLISGLLISFIDAAAVISSRTCKSIALRTDRMHFEPAGEIDDGRLVIPFMVKLHGPKSTAIQIYIGTGSDIEEDDFYVITISKDRGLIISRIINDQEKGKENTEMDSIADHQVLVPNVLTGLYLRVRQRDEYTSVSIYGEGEEGKDPILFVKDQERKILVDDLTTFGFRITGDSTSAAELQYSCQSPLNGPCIHSIDCTPVGSECIKDHHGHPICVCDEENVPDKRKGLCIPNPVVLGDKCESSRQCARVNAKCRMDEKRNDRRCVCFENNQIVNDGKCEDKRDRGHLDFPRLFRKPTWNDLSPGRPYVAAEGPLTKFQPQESCNIDLSLSGSKDFPDPKLPRKMFPLHWDRHGFKGGLHVKGKGPITMEISHGGKVLDRNPLFLAIKFEDSTLSLERNEKDLVKQVNGIEVPLIQQDAVTRFWYELSCTPVGMNKKPNATCHFTIGRTIQEGADEVLLRHPLRNPWIDDPSGSKEGLGPTHVSFRPGGQQTEARLKSECLWTNGQRCALASECFEVHENMECTLGYCECVSNFPKWNNEAKVCT